MDGPSQSLPLRQIHEMPPCGGFFVAPDDVDSMKDGRPAGAWTHAVPLDDGKEFNPWAAER
jgi:hypothetical protein